MVTSIAIALALLCVVLATALAVLKLSSSRTGRTQVEPEQVAAVRRGGVAARAARRRRNARADDDVRLPQSDDDQDEDDEGETSREAGGGNSRAARLAARKAAKRALKEEQRAAREDADEDDDKPLPRSAYEESRRQKEQEREEAEALQDAEIRAAQEERLQREAAEYEAWHGTITLEGQGEAAASRAQEEDLQQSLADYIIKRKVVGFEELSAEFKIHTKAVVEHIKVLVGNGTLSGIMDDRGKYIYLSKEELAALAEHIRTKGRVSIANLSIAASKILDLEGKEVEGFEALADDI